VHRGDLVFDVALALVPSGLQDVAVILVCQVRRQQPHGREVQGTPLEQLDDQREALRGTGGLNPSVGGTFGQVEDLGAVGEERRAALPEVQLARVQFGQRRNQMRGGRALLLRQPPHFVNEFTV
jgi:hypothetical protein